MTCPRIRFRQDLVTQLEKWRASGDGLIVCTDANEDIHQKEIGWALTNLDGLSMSEVVGDFTGTPVGPTFFQGKNPLMEYGRHKIFKW